MLFAVTSRRVWWFLRPLTAAYIARIMVLGCPFAPRPPRRGPAMGWCVGRSRSCDDGAVDVGEDLLLHLGLVDRGDHGLGLRCDHVGGAVDRQDGGARALLGGELDAFFEPLDGPRVVGADAA